MYYNDPLKAAYMAREFGVKFIDEEGLNKYWYIDDILNEPTDTEDVKLRFARHDNKRDIHPDSYHIFEPQEDDVFIHDNDGVCTFVRAIPNSVGLSIIQRKGKHFFMPEVD